MGPLPVRLRVEIMKIAASESGNESGVLRLPLDQAQQLLWGEAVVDRVELRDSENPWQLGSRVREVLAAAELDLQVQGLEQLHRPLLVALALERAMIFVAVGLMLVVAALNLLCNVAMVAAEKRTDLAVLGGLGLAPSAQRRLFLLLGLGIGIAGSIGGALLGAAISMLLDATGAVPLPRGVFAVSAVPFKVDPVSVAVVVLSALAIAAGASWLPSRLVARREAAEGLRYE
jgi:lipoprotein-releasing system permease protein